MRGKWKKLIKQGLAVSLALAMCMTTGQFTALADAAETAGGGIEADSEAPKPDALTLEDNAKVVSGSPVAGGVPGEVVADLDTEKDSDKEPREHTHDNWGEGEITKEATCTETGVRTFKCQEEGCEETKTEEIPVADHKDEGGDGVCDICGASLTKADPETDAETDSETDPKAAQNFIQAVEALKNWEAKEDASEEEMEKALADYKTSYERAKDLYEALTDEQKLLGEVQKAYEDLTAIGESLELMTLEDEECDGGENCTHVAAIGGRHYDTLQAAFNAAEDSTSTTVTMLSDITKMKTADIVTVATGKNITFDMAGHSINVDSDFAGRPIDNKGTLIVKGNGTIDSSNSNKGYGAIRNDGTLTIEGGRYIGSVYGDGAAIRNGIGSNLTVKGGYFAATGAIYNAGKAVIYKGEFVSLACSGCGTPYAYALNNRDENGVSGTMQITPEKDEDVVVHGTQGALAAVGGAKVTVEGGTFYTYPCKNNHTGSTFYALYVSGKEGLDTATCIVNGGKFSTTGANACVYLTNLNPADNGGNPGEALVRINGGSFDQGLAGKLINFNGKPGGTLEITNGKFNGSDLSSVTPYIAPGMELDSEGKVIPLTAETGVAETDGVYYATLQAAIDAAKSDKTVTLCKNTNENIVIGEGQVLTLDLNGCTLNGGTVAGKAALLNKGTVTITDGIGGGTIKREDNGTSGYYTVRNDYKMYIQGGTITNNSNTSNLLINYNNQGGGNFGGVKDVYMEISGGTISQTSMSALKNDPGCTMHITGDATVIERNSSNVGAWACNFYGKVIIDGGTITTSGIIPFMSHTNTNGLEFAGEFMVTGNAKLNCFGLYLVNGMSGGKTGAAPKLTISGNAEINAKQIYQIVNNDGLEVTNDKVSNIDIDGGIFYGGCVNNNTKGYIVPGMGMDRNGKVVALTAETGVAEVGGKYYGSLQDAVNVAQTGDVVNLLQNITVTGKGTQINAKTITLDLNGKTITGEKILNDKGYGAVNINKGSNVTVIGNGGGITAEGIPLYVYGGGKLTVNGGTYKGNTAGCLYAEEGDITVYDGHFSCDAYNGKCFVLNKKDQNKKQCNFIVYGGTFINCNPAANDNENPVENQVAPGYKVVDNGNGVYTVVAKYIAQIGETKYETLQEAIKAANEGDTVTLLKDVTVDTWDQICDVKGVTIDGKNNTLTVNKIESNGNGDYLLYGAENLTVKDLNVTLNGARGAFDMKSGSLSNVTVTGGTYAVLPGTGGVNISGCTFNGQKEMAIYTPDNTGAHDLVVDNCKFDSTRIAILWDNEKITNCTATGNTSYYQLTIVGKDTIVNGNTFSAPLELFAQPGEIKKNNFSNLAGYNDGKIFVGSLVPGQTVTVNLSENYWGGNAPEAVEGVTVTSYYSDAPMNNLVIIGSSGGTTGGNTSGGGTTTGGGTSGGGTTTGGGTTSGGTSGGGTPAPAAATPAPAAVTPAPAAAPTPAAATPEAEEPAEAENVELNDEETPLAGGEDAEEAEEETATLEDEKVPLAAKKSNHWWLFSIIPILLATGGIFFIILWKRRKKEEEEEA